jgi:hypothetical protein
MEIKADCDPGAIERHLDRIQRQMEELRAELPVEFADWQNTDMNRKQAQTRTIDVERPTANFTRASTTILPTSRFRFKLRRKMNRRLKKAGKIQSIRPSTRPVLRRELLIKFKARFVALLEGAF